MGKEHALFDETAEQHGPKLFDGLLSQAVEHAKKEIAAEREKVANARADNMALWALADERIPEDIKAFFAVNRIPAMGEECCRQMFIIGWRLALKKFPEN